MKNLQELIDKYKKYPNGLGHIRWGGKAFYEINSDKKCNLNSVGGNSGWITNDKGEVENYEFFEAPTQYYVGGEEINAEKYFDLIDELVDFWGEDSYLEEERLGLVMIHDNVKKWFGKTLDNYYPHPWYPDKEISGFELIRDIPFGEVNTVYPVKEDRIKITKTKNFYYVKECLEHPEFFKPIYKNK